MKKPKVDVESRSQNDDPVPIVIISEALANFFGSDEREMSQAEALRQIWEYIKVHQLEVCNQVNGFYSSFHFIIDFVFHGKLLGY